MKQPLPTVEQANKMLSFYLRHHYSLTLDDVEIADTRGYWVIKKPCDSNCHHPIHSTLFNSGRSRHTISFQPGGRNSKGQFMSRYRVWDAIKYFEDHT